MTLTKITTPKYESYQLSTNKHFKISFLRPFGGGKVFIICSRISSTPNPVFPEHGMALEESIPITSSICFFVFSISDAAKSVLLSTGTIS